MWQICQLKPQDHIASSLQQLHTVVSVTSTLSTHEQTQLKYVSHHISTVTAAETTRLILQSGKILHFTKDYHTFMLQPSVNIFK